MLSVGIASGLGTVDLVGIRPDLPASLMPLLITAIAVIGAAASPPPKVPAGRSRTILGLFGLWLAWSCVSAAFSAGPALAFATSASFIAVMLAAMSLAAHRSRTALLAAMAIAAFVHALAALVIAFTVEFDQFPSRLALVELEANHLGRLLALSCLVAVLWLLEHEVARWAPVVLFTGVSLMGLLLTGSRTAPAALVMAGFVGLLAARRWRLLIAGGIGLVVVVVGLLASGFDSRIVALTNRTGSDLSNLEGGNGRTTLWPEVLDVIQDEPMTGVGLGVDRERMRQINAETEISWDPQHAHNLVLHLAFTTGWIGTILFVVGLVLALVTALQRGDPWVAALVAFVAVDGIAEPVFRIPQPTWVMLIASVALLGGAQRHVDKPPSVMVGAPAGAGETRALVGAGRRDLRLPVPFGILVVSTAVVLVISIGLVWQEPGQYPGRFRCRDVVALNSAGLLVDVDPASGTVVTPAGETPLPAREIEDGSLEFSAGESGISLPSDVARAVRCGAIRGQGITVEFDVATFGLDTEGPGRIVTISVGPEWQDIDLHIGQQLDGLSLRFRQSSTYRNDATIPGIFTDLETHRIRVEVWEDRVDVSKDGVLVESWTDFAPIQFDEWIEDRTAHLGNEVNGGRPFVGTLDSLRIYEGHSAPDEQAG